MTSCKPPPTCIDASPIPDANDSRMSAIPYEANLTPMGTVPLPHDVLVGPEVHDLHREIDEYLPLLIREGEDALQLADERLRDGIVSCSQDGAPLCLRRERDGLSVVSAYGSTTNDKDILSRRTLPVIEPC